jgi:hypothetical protein
MIFRAFAFLVAVLAGVLLSQVPEFAQQYRQRLGGAIDELARIIAYFDEDAARSGYDRAGALALMAGNEERLVRDQARRMKDTMLRYDRLTTQQQAFRDAGPFGRLAVFVRDFDRPLVENTLRDFEPALPTTIEGTVFAAGGFLAVYLLLRGLGLLFRSPRRQFVPRAQLRPQGGSAEQPH